MISAGTWEQSIGNTDHKTVIGHLLRNRYNSASNCFLFRCIPTFNLCPDWHGMKNAIETELSTLMQAALNGDTGKYQDFLKQAVHPSVHKLPVSCLLVFRRTGMILFRMCCLPFTRKNRHGAWINLFCHGSGRLPNIELLIICAG